jgi:hypothetical protein
MARVTGVPQLQERAVGPVAAGAGMATESRMPQRPQIRSPGAAGVRQ